MLVFVDTNVWYPVVLADLVLRSVEIGLFDLAWTDESLVEVDVSWSSARDSPRSTPPSSAHRCEPLLRRDGSSRLPISTSSRR